MSKKVFIGVGHGGPDSGATGNGLKEKDVNLSISLACRDELTQHGVTVQMSRTKDEADPLTDEIKECNAFNPELALDIHNNAGGGDGAEVYHYSKGGTSKALAQNILNAITAIGQNSRGLKTKLNSNGSDYFGFIREIKAPSVIVECAFVDNATDVQIINTAAKQKTMGVAIARGVLKTLGIEILPTDNNTKPPTNTADTVYVVQSGDTLSGIAQKYGTTYQVLAAHNGIANPSMIHAGQKINIPGTGAAKLKSIDEIAKEVINGQWGNGDQRKQKLIAAGYNFTAVQKRVNEMLK